MHPVLNKSHLCWCILWGHLLISMQFVSLGQCRSEGIKLGTFTDEYFESVSSNEYRRGIPNYIKTSASLSSPNDSVSCEKDLKGVGSFNTTCVINLNLHLDHDIYIFGTSTLEIRPHVSIVCAIEGCSISFNLSGSIEVGQYASLVAGSVTLSAANLTLHSDTFINTSALGGPPPTQTSGTPYGTTGAGGGHGGRGASCKESNTTNLWGGDVYAWSTLNDPWSYGSKGGSASAVKMLGGNGGGRIKLFAKDVLYLNGSVTAEGGVGGPKGGGGSGGSIKIHALKMKGTGAISAAGGKGWGGGGGGRISLECYSIQGGIKVTVHGGESIGCPGNAGAAGTIFDATLQSLRVSNDNVTTRTETPLLDFPTRSLWSNVFVENNAKVLVPLLWSRMQVRGQISILYGASISFGLSDFPVSEFELVAEELLMSDSIIEVYGAFRIAVKMLLMWNSKVQIDGGGYQSVATSVLEVRNLVVLRENSVIITNGNLAVYGQGLLRLTGRGDAIKGQRLFLSLFYNITVGPGSLIQAPLDGKDSRNLATKAHCESQTCPLDLINPPEDCHLNDTLSFSLQICRVEDLTVSGIMKGSILHIRTKTVIIDPGGMISASENGCEEGIGKGNYSNGAGGGAGHGGEGGSGFSQGMVRGGKAYGNAELPCELGSGSGSLIGSSGNIVGGGMIVMGSPQWPLARLDISGSLKADGQSYSEAKKTSNITLSDGLGGGSGGTILLFLQELTLGDNSSLSVAGGNGGPAGGGGGGGGRVHFHWSRIAQGDEYVPLATLNGTINNSGGTGKNRGRHGQYGTITGKKCPKGLYGTFCNECPVGTYKDVDGSDEGLCSPCPLELLPQRADFIYIRGGVAKPFCPYKCMSEKYRMPNCYTPLEELIYTFGGPWPFAILLSFIIVIFAILLSTIRIKLVGSGYAYRAVDSSEHHNRHHFPLLLSLAEVRGTSRAEETHSHVHRMHFMGPNTFREPWHLPYSPPEAIIEIVYEDAFNRFIDEINSVAAYEWWEGSVHSILSVLAYPCAWSWKQWRRRNKIHRLQEYVKSEYDHSCLQSCRSRALYKGMKVGATPDLMVAYIDFFLGGDEKRLDVPSVQQRFPICIIFGGDGSYMSPYNLHSDTLLTNLLSEHVPATIWDRFVAGLNAQLRTVRQSSIRSSLVPVFDWINTHANPKLEHHGVRMQLGWFQATASGYYQLGVLIAVGDYSVHNLHRSNSLGGSTSAQPRIIAKSALKSIKQLQQSLPYTGHVLSRQRITGGSNGGVIDASTIKSLDYKRDFLFPFSLFLHNTRPIGLQDGLQLLISIMLLGDLAITLLTLIHFYWMSLGAFLAFLLILPLSLLSPFPAGLNALFSQGPKRASLARVYALWNASSLSNIVVAFICGVLHYGLLPLTKKSNAWNGRREDDRWWILPTILLLIKSIQARFIDRHIANLEIQDPSLFSQDPESFWGHDNETFS